MTKPTAAARNPRTARSPGAARWLCFAALFFIGAYTGLLGPLLPELAARSGVSLGRAGAVFTALFGAGIVSTAVSGWAMDRIGRRRPLAVGLALDGAALMLLPWMPSWFALLLAAALLGLGDGTVAVGVHVVIADISPDHEAAALNHLNVAFGVGAVLAPGAAAAMRAAGGDATLILMALGACQIAAAALVGAGVVALGRPRTARDGAAGGQAAGRQGRLLASRLLWLLAVLLLIYVGIELGLGGWAFTYGREAGGLSVAAATALSSGFWLALTAGRLLSPLVLRRWSAGTLMLGGALIATAASAALLFAGDLAAVIVAGILVAGFGFGPIWPVTFALAARSFPAASGKVTGLLAMLSALGGLTIPWLQGWLLDTAGSAAGIGVTFAGCLVLTLLTVALRGRPRLTASPVDRP